ncbi:MAG: riboflavin synthase [Nitrospirota bacterium]|nr:riboflavin synthase [Nitrospirota bacterium]MDH5768871.1 riboflavin synthase [Nitrospirota bacterium]
MFTGIIVEMGEVAAVERRTGILHLSLRAKEIIKDVRIGDSISINGVCLTAVDVKNDTLKFDLSDETLRSTNLGQLRTGNRVNLEPSLRPDSKLGGHFVLGHVDGIGRIKSKIDMGDAFKVEIEASGEIIHLLVEKGSVALDGISLTVVDILKDSFTVVIIPHTAKNTTIGLKGPGETVNIEIDIIGKYVARFLNKEKNKDSKLMKTLTEEGFIKK